MMNASAFPCASWAVSTRGSRISSGTTIEPAVCRPSICWSNRFTTGRCRCCAGFAIGRRVLNTNPDTVHALQAYEQVVEATVVASSAPELREYIFDDYVLLYLLTDDTIYLVSIRHSKEVSFDFEYLWGAER